MDIPQIDMRGKVCVVTGANAGIGRRVALGLAQMGARVVMACRNQDRALPVRDEIRRQSDNPGVKVAQVDLSSQASIRKMAAAFQLEYDRLDVLINNAANFDQTIKKPILTEDGVETVFATNHLGPFLLTNLILEMLNASAPARVLNVASKGLLSFPFLSIEFNNLYGEKKYSVAHAYYQSKLAQLMFTFDLAKRLQGSGVTVNCIRVTNVRLDDDRLGHLPGWMRSLYSFKARMAITSENMAETYLNLAARPEFAEVSGTYFDENCHPVKASARTYDTEVWQKLWDTSAGLVGMSPAEAVQPV